MKIVGKIEQNKFRKFVLVAIIIVSVNFFISGSVSIPMMEGGSCFIAHQGR